MLRILLMLAVGWSLPCGLIAQAAAAKGESGFSSLRAEKPFRCLPRDPGDHAPRDRIRAGTNPDRHTPTELYRQVKAFHDEGGQPWIELGVENTVENAIEHLIEDHNFTREQLRGFDLITLNWIHGMAHERGNPELLEAPLRAER